MPSPLSFMRIFPVPPCSTSTITCVLFASIALSSNSLTTACGLSITSPAAIFRATCGKSSFIGFSVLNSVFVDICFTSFAVFYYSFSVEENKSSSGFSSVGTGEFIKS